MASFEQASHFTLNPDIKKLLIDCSHNKWPPSFTVKRGKIHTAAGNIYDIHANPMDLCNLVHDILSGIERKNVTVLPSTRKASEITDDMIVAFSRRETERLSKDETHIDKLAACIHTALFLGVIVPADFRVKGDVILSINGIDTEVPLITR